MALPLPRMLACLGLAAMAGTGLAACGGEAAPPPERPAARPAMGPGPNDLYVDKDARGGPCDDARPAAKVSARTPWCTLERAAAAAKDGSRVWVRAGAYGDQTFDETIAHREPVTLQAYPRERPTVGYTIFDSAKGVRMTALRFTRTIEILEGSARRIELVGNEHAGFKGPGVLIGPGARDVLIQGAYMHDLDESGSGTDGVGVHASGYSAPITNLRIMGNRFHRTKGSGIALGGVTDAVVEGNDVADVVPNEGSPIHSDPLIVQSCEGLLVRDNVFRRNQQAIVMFDGVSDVTFENNVIVGGQNYGINFQGDAPNLRLRNNTIWDNELGGIVFQKDAPTAQITSNILQSFGFTTAKFTALEDYNLVLEGGRGAHDSASAPRFVAPARQDYRLAPGSPGVDAGASEGAPFEDVAGHARRDDPSVRDLGAGPRPWYDVGAYEAPVR